MHSTALRWRGVLVALIVITVAPLDAQDKPRVPPGDYAKWENLGSGELSPDGAWLTVQISRVDMDGELQIHDLSRPDSMPIVVKNATNPAFSADSRWLAFSIGYGEKERAAREKADQPVHSRVGLLNLATRQQTELPGIASFAFSGDGRFIAMRGYTAEGQKNRGVDLLVRDLSTGDDIPFGNVASYAWQDEGSLLAFLIDADVRSANGVQLFTPTTRTIRTLESDSATYTELTWRDESADLAVLKLTTDSVYADSSHVVLSWTGLDGRAPVKRTFDPATAAGFPADTRIVDFRTLEWSDDGATLFFGIRERQRRESAAEEDSVKQEATADKEEKDEDDEKPGVEVWHAKDVDIMPEQKLRAAQNRRRNDLAAWHLEPDHFVRLSDESLETISLFDEQQYALAMDGRPYDQLRMFGPAYRDLYIVDVASGQRTKVKDRVEFQYGSSPGGRYVLYLQDDHYWVYDVEKDTHTNITTSAPVSFIDHADDHTVDQKPPFGNGGWTEDDESVLLYSEYDVWEVSPDGTKHVNLTNTASERVRSRLVRLDIEVRTYDLEEPVYVALYGERTKKYGYGRLTKNGVEKSVWLDRSVTRIRRADDADVFLYSVAGFDDSPDYFVGSGALTDARQVTNTNPFQADYAWGRSELLDYVSARGDSLQAALYYPAGHEPGRKYPMLVYFYEITSNTLHSYQSPSEHGGYNPTVWTQEGYFVLRPDILYRDRNPGLSAVDALVPAVQRAVATGMIDGAKVGLIGHSWGGYQTAFVPTQTDVFAAAVAGAPLTELYSMYLSIYWNSGGTDARIFEISQGRMEVPPWQDLDSYLANSPVHHIENLNTPMLIAFGDKDGAVDWHQGIVMYNAARRAGKDVVMLVYEGENHGLAKEPNQVDYHRRILEWFGHYLKGEEAPGWITKGVPFLEKEDDLRPRRVVTPPDDGGRGGG